MARGRQWQEVQLQIGDGFFRSGFQERTGLGQVAGQLAGSEAYVAIDLLRPTPEFGRVKGHRSPGFRTVLQEHVAMVLQVLADAGQFVHHGDAVLAKLMRRTDAGEHQQLR